MRQSAPLNRISWVNHMGVAGQTSKLIEDINDTTAMNCLYLFTALCVLCMCVHVDVFVDFASV